MDRRLPISLDALLVTILVLARARVDTIANLIVQRPAELVRQIPFFGTLLPQDAFNLLVDPQADPLSQLVLSITFGLVTVYLVIDIVQHWPTRRPPGTRRNSAGFWAKLVVLVAICLFSVGANTGMVMALRHVALPSQFAHDGGVLMAEQAVKWLLEGKNVYEQDFRGTLVTEAYPDGPGTSHYPYLPFAFVPSVPVYLVTMNLWGWFDERIIYLIAFGAILALAPFIARERGDKLALLALLGLNPVLANDMIYGFNDMLVVGLMVAAAASYRMRAFWLGSVFVGLAAATKGTVWAILPFVVLFLWQGRHRRLWELAKPLIPLTVAAAIFILPFAIWNLPAMYEDTISYNSGAAIKDGLPIKGWGLAAFVVATGQVTDLFAPYSFAIFEALFALPVIIALLWRQWRSNTLAALFANFGISLFLVAYFSRTMNPNYIGFALAMLAIGFFGVQRPEPEAAVKPDAEPEIEAAVV